jgi:hypothetical protein
MINCSRRTLFHGVSWLVNVNIGRCLQEGTNVETLLIIPKENSTRDVLWTLLRLLQYNTVKFPENESDAVVVQYKGC